MSRRARRPVSWRRSQRTGDGPSHGNMESQIPVKGRKRDLLSGESWRQWTVSLAGVGEEER